MSIVLDNGRYKVLSPSKCLTGREIWCYCLDSAQFGCDCAAPLVEIKIPLPPGLLDLGLRLENITKWTSQKWTQQVKWSPLGDISAGRWRRTCSAFMTCQRWHFWALDWCWGGPKGLSSGDIYSAIWMACLLREVSYPGFSSWSTLLCSCFFDRGTSPSAQVPSGSWCLS